HMTNTRNTPIESLEHAVPMRVARVRIRAGSGGRGRWRGGEGIEKRLEMLAPARVTVMSDRRVRRPYGLAGGAAGAPGFARVRTREGGERTLPGKCQVDLAAGAVLTLASPGGGGFGRSRRARATRRR